MALFDWLRLSLTDGLGPVLTARLIERTGSAEYAVEATTSLLRSVEGIGRSRGDAIHTSLRASLDLAKEELEKASRVGARLICLDDEEYPILLSGIPGPPPVLYLRGKFEPRDVHAVGVVGSRRCSIYGREVSEKFAGGLAGVGVTIVSGGARGVDAHAHKGALLPREGRTIAVVGCGVDIAYPPEHVELFETISKRGAVVSEFALGTPPVAENFPRRNRLISGLSRGVLVVEADIRSGALITARYAVDEHGRPVFAVPGRVDNPLSAGPHKLIRDGAVLVERFSDILENLGPLPDSVHLPASPPVESVATLFEEPTTKKKPAPAGPALSERQEKIMTALDGASANVDQIIDRTGLDAQTVLQELTMLSLRGAVRRVEGQTYARK